MPVSEYKIVLYCAGFMIISSAWLLVCTEGLNVFALLRYTMILVFGYLAMLIDLNTRHIPNSLILSMLSVWLFVMIPQIFLDTETGIRLLKDSVLGLLTGGGLFLLVYLISRNGLGGGDVKFMAAAGLYLGFRSTIPAILYGTTLAALTGIVLILLKKIGRKDTMPLAPFLYVGILITVFMV